jgi:hypothetical protein
MQTSPLAKDFFWQALQSFFTIKASHASFSKSYNCIAVEKMHLTTSLTRQVDAQALLQQPIGAPLKLTKQVHDRVVEVIKNTMTLSMREIDPATYMQTKSLRLYPLENGLSMAIYGLVPERQLPLQSYVGYTLFKNGYPISYGGAWVLGRWSLFALNVFEEYRGGESKYVMTQILRVYAQVFGVHCFEVEPFQFGNEDAIKTGAFWFYYKFGFRPLNKTTLALANSEVAKMAKNKAYRSNEKILTQLANGNIALLLSDDKYTHRNAVIEPISQLIAGRYKGNHMAAIADAKNFFINHAPLLKKWNKDEETVFEEMALWAYAHRITQKDTLAIMIKMIQSKPKDFIAYNNLVKQII